MPFIRIFGAAGLPFIKTVTLTKHAFFAARTDAIKASSTVGSFAGSKPKNDAVISVNSVFLLIGVPTCVGSSARTRSNVSACPSTAVSFTRPGYLGTLSFNPYTSPQKISPLKNHAAAILLMRNSKSTRIFSISLALAQSSPAMPSGPAGVVFITAMVRRSRFTSPR